MTDRRDGPDAATLDAWAAHLGDGRPDPVQLRADLCAGSLPDVLRATAAAHPAALALVVDGAELTHAALADRAGRFAGWLTDAGVDAGDHVLLCAPSSVDLVTAYLGVLAAGAVAVLAGPDLAEPELRHRVDDSGAGMVLTGGAAAEPLATVIAGDPAVRLVMIDGSDGPAMDELVDRSGGPLWRPVGGDDVAILGYTSGTTGRPKGARLTHANVLASVRAAIRSWRWRADDVIVHALPLYHQHGLSAVHMAILSGCCAVVHAAFDPQRLTDELRTRPATVLLAVPAMYERLLAHDGFDADATSPLRLAVSGSAPLPADTASQLADRLGQLPLERYGTTESGLNVSNRYDGPRRPGRIGWPLPGVEARIAGEDGAALSPGEDGELLVRGPQVFGGYHEREDATADSFHPPGWFRTGDIARADPGDGAIEIVGRSKEMILSGGQNVYPREVEDALVAHPDVAEAAVTGEPSQRWGEQVTAFVVPRAGAAIDADALIAHVRERLARYKAPKRVVEVDRLPRNDMGKVERDRLSDAAAGDD